MWIKLFFIGLAGALGTLARYGLSGIIQRTSLSTIPLGTVFVNLLGCLVFGLAWELTTERFQIHPELRASILIGFMGAFTTFSTFIFESGRLLTDGELLVGLGYMLAQIGGGLLLFFSGVMLARMI